MCVCVCVCVCLSIFNIPLLVCLFAPYVFAEQLLVLGVRVVVVVPIVLANGVQRPFLKVLDWIVDIEHVVQTHLCTYTRIYGYRNA